MVRIQRNPAYSLRAFARDLGMSHAYLSLVMNGKRKLSLKRLPYLTQMLELSPSESKDLFDAAAKTSAENIRASVAKNAPEYYQLEIDQLKTISQWYHLAILDLTQLKSFKSDASWVAKRLGLKTQTVRTAQQRLIRLGLMKVVRGRWVKTHAKLQIPTSYSKPLQSYHTSMIEKALDALVSPPKGKSELRDISGALIPINSRRLPEAKRRIAKFRRQMIDFLAEENCDSLYHLNVQFFPLSLGEKRYAK